MAAEKPDSDALDLLDNDYDSAQDEDFQLDDDAAGEDSGLSSSEGEDDEVVAQEQRPAKKRKLDSSSSKAAKKGKDGDEELALDSGDEATIRKAKQRKKPRKGGKGDEDDVDFDEEDEEGGEGGFVKTRSMRMKMQEERKPLAKIDGATIDVDEIWARMNGPGTDPGLQPTTTADEPENGAPDEEKEPKDTPTNGEAQPIAQKLPSEEMIKIKRTYKFAGEMITEEKLVPKDSAEAKLFLAESKGDNKAVTDADVDDAASKKSALKLRRPLRKFSRFDPNPQGLIKKSWEKQPQQATDEEEAKGPKLNTVEKSRLDWAQYVDEAGIKDELNVHSKAKEGYLGRMDFLNRVDEKREEERRRLRLKGL